MNSFLGSYDLVVMKKVTTSINLIAASEVGKKTIERSISMLFMPVLDYPLIRSIIDSNIVPDYVGPFGLFAAVFYLLSIIFCRVRVKKKGKLSCFFTILCTIGTVVFGFIWKALWMDIVIGRNEEVFGIIYALVVFISIINVLVCLKSGPDKAESNVSASVPEKKAEEVKEQQTETADEAIEKVRHEVEQMRLEMTKAPVSKAEFPEVEQMKQEMEKMRREVEKMRKQIKVEYRKRCNVCGKIICYSQDEMDRYYQNAGRVENAAKPMDKLFFDFTHCPNCHSVDISDFEEEPKQEQAAEAAPAAQVISTADELKKFKTLRDLGIISHVEYDAKKRQILGL